MERCGPARTAMIDNANVVDTSPQTISRMMLRVEETRIECSFRAPALTLPSGGHTLAGLASIMVTMTCHHLSPVCSAAIP